MLNSAASSKAPTTACPAAFVATAPVAATADVRPVDAPPDDELLVAALPVAADPDVALEVCIDPIMPDL